MQSTKNLTSFQKSIHRIDYEIPERYRNAFYLANAAFFDSTNWFLHRAYGAVFPFLKNTYRRSFKNEGVNDVKIHEKIENIVESLDQCNSIIDVRFPVRRESGKLEVIRGFRAHYGETVQNTPCLGGLRIHDDITRDHMKALSLISFLKNSCMGTGLSGAMGGIKIDPNQYSENELKNIVEHYATELFKKGYCNHGDIVHPDINTDEREMKWINETFAKCSGQSLNATSTGKPLEYGGVEGFESVAALGALKALETFADDSDVMLKIGYINRGLKNKRFIIQGLGKVGKPLGLLLSKSGAICVGVKEKEAYLYDTKGIDLNALYKYREEHGTIENFGLSKTEYPDSIFTEDCDILVLCAAHKSLACYIARDVKAKIILEAAGFGTRLISVSLTVDGPVTPSAHKILTTKSKLVIPDIYASAGSSVVSYFEYLRNVQQIGLPTENLLRFSTKVYTEISNNMTLDKQRFAGGSQTHSNVFVPLDSNFSKNSIECIYSMVGQEILKNLQFLKLGVDVRTAAYAVAINNMFKIIFEQKTLT